jgi:hypothetical protein
VQPTKNLFNDSFLEYLQNENNLERANLLQKTFENNAEPFTQKHEYFLWYALSALPTKLERSRIAQHIKVEQQPDSRWCAATYLLSDTSQDVVANAINSFTFSKNRKLGHRLFSLFDLEDKPQRVLYCLARYAEETCDTRFAEKLTSVLSHDLSDAFLARTFNALYRLGIKNTHALGVALQLVETHIQATNMDRKAAVSAVLYLCFAGNQEHILKLSEICSHIKIPELRRMLSWGLSCCLSYSKNNFALEDAQKFLTEESEKTEPLFTGYGCFSEEIILQATTKVFTEVSNLPPDEIWKRVFSLTRTVLTLGEKKSVEWLCSHPTFGLLALLNRVQNAFVEKITELWYLQSPSYCQTFLNICNSLEFAQQQNEAIKQLQTSAFQIFSEAEVFLSLKYKKLFKSILREKNVVQAEELLVSNILCIERSKVFKKPDQNQEVLEDQFLSQLQNSVETFGLNSVSQKVYSILLGGKFSRKFLESVVKILGLQSSQWSFSALAVTASSIHMPFATELLQTEVNFLLSEIHSGNLAEDAFMGRLISCYLSVLLCSQKFNFKVEQEVLDTLNHLAEQIQAIFDAVEQAEPEAANDSKSSSEGLEKLNGREEDEEEPADLNQNVVSLVDKPLLRWNSLVQTLCKDNKLPQAHQSELSTQSFNLLKNSLRLANHVDKRWVVKGLAKLASQNTIHSEDAVKALLYQALQHIDQELVALTIRELIHIQQPRIQQTLIRCVGRSNVPDELKLLILEEIPTSNPNEILQELRTLELLRMPQHIDEAVRDAVGRVASLIDIEQTFQTTKQIPFNHQDVDLLIKKHLPQVDKLGVDIRSALRTAEMILIQSKDWGSEAVDLSPIVNMYCKAVELTLRDLLEPLTDAVIRKGVLSRKLDLLGYSRPIPEKMQIFEDFLAGLPVVNSIPYFSKFKLRKMLRAICFYRPGKRFTLDGPKAFALLLLVASRKECPFGLEKIFDVGLKTDVELFEYIKLIHSLQDSRNRAVHEGLTWEAQDEIDSLRKQAYRIIEICITIEKNIKNLK